MTNCWLCCTCSWRLIRSISKRRNWLRMSLVRLDPLLYEDDNDFCICGLISLSTSKDTIRRYYFMVAYLDQRDFCSFLLPPWGLTGSWSSSLLFFGTWSLGAPRSEGNSSGLVVPYLCVGFAFELECAQSWPVGHYWLLGFHSTIIFAINRYSLAVKK